MNQPTIEEIESEKKGAILSILEKHTGNNYEDVNLINAAVEIYDMFIEKRPDLDIDKLIDLGFIEENDGSNDPSKYTWMYVTDQFVITVDPGFNARLNSKKGGLEGVGLKVESMSDLEAAVKLITPTFKPLSELHKDEQACRKIFKFVTGGECRRFSVTENDGIIMVGSESNIMLLISKDGRTHGCERYNASTIFSTVDFIRSLGYAPNKQS